MSTAKTIAGIVPGLMAVGLVGNQLKSLKPTIGTYRKGKHTIPRKASFGKMNKSFVKTGVTALVGTQLISATAKSVNDIP